MTADLAAGTAPDVYVLKNLKNFTTYQDGGQLADVSDVAAKLGNTVGGLSSYKIDGKSYAVPYRQDSWVLYYNKDLFDKAKVSYPDGSWTWDDYATKAKELTTGLKGAGSAALGTYQHSWQSTVQGFALAQTSGASLESGNFSYVKPYYERVTGLQTAGAQANFGTVTTNKLTYQAQFGKQSAAMLPMGTWYIATLIKQRGTGDADKFNWGIAPAPQFDSSTTGTSKTPVTFGDPTGLGINPAISDGGKVTVAKEFLAYAAGEAAAKALAGIGITPANTSDAVAQAFFALDGVPGDALSKFSWSKHDTKPENPVSKHTPGLQNVLNTLHSAVLSNSKGIDDAITAAQTQAKNEVLNQ
jgi:multiple sugar transport system substrate-binding protein